MTNIESWIIFLASLAIALTLAFGVAYSEVIALAFIGVFVVAFLGLYIAWLCAIIRETFR